jgi:hypothetical protein
MGLGMSTRSKIIIPIGVAAVIGVILAFAASAGPTDSESMTYIPKRVLTLQTGSTMLPEAEAAATCGESLEHVRSIVSISVRTPTTLPEGYALKAVDFSPPNTIYMKFSDGPVCGGDGMKLRDGVIELNQGPLSALTTEKSGADYIQQQLPKYEASQMGAETYEFANGLIAIGYPAGVGTSEAIDENNVVVHSEKYDYPASIWAFDDRSQTIYYLKAYLPLEDLVKIAESLK